MRNLGWPPEMEAAYQKWLEDNEHTCLCLNCLQVRMRKARREAEKREIADAISKGPS
jgi:hypothetical protein